MYCSFYFEKIRSYALEEVKKNYHFRSEKAEQATLRREQRTTERVCLHYFDLLYPYILRFFTGSLM